MTKLVDFMTNPETEKKGHLFSIIWISCLFLIGLLGWGLFLNFGNIPFNFHDWAEINAPRLAFLKDAVMKNVLPLHMPDSSALRGVTDRYFALPDVIFSPQIILLKWLSVGKFILVHIWILYGIGFLGLLRIKKYYSLSLLNFSWIFFLFFFNGHLLSHISVGHCTWGGNFLFPWFIYLVILLLDDKQGWKWVAQMSFLLFFIFLQGSFHQYIWCIIFLGFLAISNFKTFWTIIKTGFFTVLISAFRIIPPAIQTNAFDDEFLGGYRTPVQLIRAFIKIISPADSLNPSVTGATLGWWEFDTYIGLIGMFFFLGGSLLWIIQHNRKAGFPQLICPLAVLSIFSIRGIYQFFRKIPIPIFSGERVSARFLILPVSFLIILAAVSWQQFALSRKHSKTFSFASLIFLIGTIYQLWNNLNIWKVTESVKAFPVTPTNLSIKIVSNHADPVYIKGLMVGMVITLLSSGILLFLALRKSNQN